MQTVGSDGAGISFLRIAGGRRRTVGDARRGPGHGILGRDAPNMIKAVSGHQDR